MNRHILTSLLVLTSFGAGMWVSHHLQGDPISPASPRPAVSLLTPASPSQDSLLDPQAPREADEKPSPDGENENRSDRPRPTLASLLAAKGEDAMRDGLDGLSTADLKGLLADLEASGETGLPARQLKEAVYQRWAHEDPRAALEAVLQESDVRLKHHVLHTAFAEMTERDLGQATAAFASLENHRQRAEAVEAMAHAVRLEQMPELASFLAGAAPALETGVLFERWGERDPSSPLLESMALEAGTDALRATARGMTRSDPAAALEWARQIDQAHPGSRAMVNALAAVSEIDPAQAAAYIDQLPPGPQTRDLVREIAHQWARQDLPSALKWSESLSDLAQRDALGALTHEWARQDPAAAAAFTQSLPPSEHRRDALAEIGHVWAQEDVRQALDWAQSLGSESTRAVHGILETVAEHNPQAAADLVTQWGSQSDPRTYRELARHVAERWSDHDPAAAAAWAQSLNAADNVQREAIQGVADHWVDQDPMAASQWIGNLPQGPLRDAAAERLVDRVAAVDPDSAYQWALSVSDPGHRADMLHHVFEEWRQLDPQTARSRLDTAPLTPEQRQDLTELFQNGERP